MGQLMGSPRWKLSQAVPGLKNRPVFVPTARPPAVEVIAGPGKDAQREGREGQRKQGNSHNCDSVQTFPGV